MSKKKVFYVLSGAILGIGVILAIFILTFGINLNSGVSLEDKNVTEHKDSNELKPIATAIGLNSDTYLDVGDDPEKIEVVEVKQVTTGGGYRLSTVYNIPNWSPDGKYFVGIKNGGTVLFNESGQKIKELGFYLRDWSPDSKKMICEGMWLIDLESDERKKVIEGKGYDPAFLPSGDRVIYHSKDGLSIVDINTGDINTVINAPDDNFSHIWYISDDKIFYVKRKRKISSDFFLYRYNSITKEERRIYSYRVIAPVYRLTPKGEIKIRSGPDPKSGDAIITDQDGKIISKIKSFLGGDWQASWAAGFKDFSPNGKLLLYTEHEVSKEEAPVKGDLYIYSIDGRKKMRITHTEDEVESEAKWSPNGDKIIFADYYTHNIYLIKISKKQ
jgi:Tol biopolymer transport system component